MRVHSHSSLTLGYQIFLISKVWRIDILHPYTNQQSVQLISQEWCLKKKKRRGKKNMHRFSQTSTLRWCVHFNWIIYHGPFEVSWGNLYHCHTVFPPSLIWPGCIWRSGDPDQMRLMGKLDFFPMIPVEENHKTTRRLGALSLLSSAHWTRLCCCSSSSCNKSVI